MKDSISGNCELLCTALFPLKEELETAITAVRHFCISEYFTSLTIQNEPFIYPHLSTGIYLSIYL